MAEDVMPTEPAYVYRAVPLRVIGGDTFVAMVDLGFRVHHETTVRLYGVNAPEHNQPGGAEATGMLRMMLLSDLPRPMLIRSYRYKQSFARWVCEAWVDDGDGWRDVAAELLTAGLAVPLKR